MAEHKTYNFINFLKGMSAIFIYTMHYIGIYCTRFNVQNYFLYLVCNITYVALPIFFMCTGFVYRGRNVDYKYILKKLAKFYILSIIVNVLAFIGKSFLTHSFSADGVVYIVKESLVLNDLTTHLWFMIPLMVLYVIMPIFNTLDKKNLFFITIVSLLFVAFKKDIPIVNKFNFSVPFAYYIYYFLVGACYKELDRKTKIKILVLFVIGFILYRIKYKGIYIGNFQSVYYNFPNEASSGNANDTFCLANILFILCDLLNLKSAFFDKMSRNCIYIYLFHPFFIHYLFDVCKMSNPYIATILWVIIYFVMSYMFYYIDKYLVGRVKTDGSK